MTHFTLVHGAWHGAWCWDRLVTVLAARGHRVSALTQTGLGERAGELSNRITLQTFVDDVVGHLTTQDITDTILVGHSFGGNSITGAAAVAADRIAGLVYLDAMVPISGVSPASTVAPDIWAKRRDGAIDVPGADGETVRCLSPSTADALGISDPDDADYVLSRMTPHPIATYETAIDFDGSPGAGLPVRYVMVTDPVYQPLSGHRDRARALGWTLEEIATGHDAMVTAPDALADLLTAG